MQASAHLGRDETIHELVFLPVCGVAAEFFPPCRLNMEAAVERPATRRAKLSCGRMITTITPCNLGVCTCRVVVADVLRRLSIDPQAEPSQPPFRDNPWFSPAPRRITQAFSAGVISTSGSPAEAERSYAWVLADNQPCFSIAPSLGLCAGSKQCRGKRSISCRARSASAGRSGGAGEPHRRAEALTRHSGGARQSSTSVALIPQTFTRCSTGASRSRSGAQREAVASYDRPRGQPDLPRGTVHRSTRARRPRPIRSPSRRLRENCCRSAPRQSTR